VTGAASFLAMAALAVVFKDGLCRRFVPDRAACTSADIILAHVFSPLCRLSEIHID
jgi:hypothetical protein